MKPRYKASLGMFGLVVLGGLVSAGVFVWVGSQVAILAVAGIVPVLAVAGFIWVRTTVQQTGVSEQRYTKQRAREVGEQFVDFWTTREQMRSQHPSYFMTEDPNVQSVVSSLEAAGVLVDTSDASFRLSNPEELEELNRAQSEISDLAADRDREFLDGISDDVESLNQSVDRLSDITTVETELSAADVPADPTGVETQGGEPWWEAMETRLADHERAVEETIRRAIDSVRSTATASDGVETDEVDRELEQAETAVSDGQFEQAIEHVVNARDRFRESGSDTFQSDREEMLSTIEAVRSAGVEKYVDESTFAELDECERRIRNLEDATDMTAMNEQGSALRRTCTDIVGHIESELDRYLTVLDDADPPMGFYQRPDVADESYVDALESTDSITAFRHGLEQALAELEEPLETLSEKADVIQAYPQMADRIEAELKRDGTVTDEDLPVKRDEEKYMGLYARQHDDVEFDPAEPSLTTDTTITTHALTVGASYESGGPEREITLEIEGDQHTDSAAESTHLRMEHEFPEVPAGEYDVRAVPGTDTHDPATETVTVEDDCAVTLTIQDVELRDKVCAGVSADIDPLLEDFGDRIDERFQTEAYVSTSMSFPIDDDYVPCLLVEWANREGYAALEADDEIIVYDDDTLLSEIENVVQYNIDAGDHLSFDDLRTKYLSVPASDSVLRDLVQGSDATGGVQLTDTGIQKEVEN